MADRETSEEQLTAELNRLRKDSEERERLISILEATNDLVATAGPGGNITYINQAGRKLLGWELGSKKEISDAHPPWAAEIIEKTAVPTCIRDGIWMGETAVIGKEGKEIPCSQVIMSHKSPEGELKYFSTIMRDITHLKLAQKVRNESETRFRNIVERSPMGIFIYRLDAGNRLVFSGSNPAADTILKVDNSRYMGKTIEEAFPPLAETEVPEKYRRAAAEGTPWQTEEIAYQDREITGAFEVHAFQTEPGAMAAMFLDITERKRTEEKLRRLQNLLSNIINSMPSVLVGVDPDGRITHWNREAERKTGVTSCDAQGCTIEDVLPLMVGEMDKVREAIRERKPRKDEKVVQETNGDIRFSDVTIYPLVANGVEGAVIRIDDITERVQIEEMMIQSEKMLTVGGLAAGMAHEINNPLAGILQNIQVIQNRFKTDLPRNKETALLCGTTIEAVNDYIQQRGIPAMLESVMESGRRAAQIVENMLSFSRKSESRMVPHDLGKLLDKAIELASNDYDLKKKYDFRGIEIIRRYDADVPNVHCEYNKIQQVFLNIIYNGAQAMAQYRNETSRPEKPVFHLRIKKEEQMVRVEIEDNGPGMEENIRRRVFEPFFTTKGVGTGTGLGLSVSYFIITENHKGTMTVESTPGRGTTFILRLPINQGGNNVE